MDRFSLRDAFQLCCYHRYRRNRARSEGQNLVIREALNVTVTSEALKEFAERSTSSCRKRANSESGFQHSASGASQLFGGVHSSNIYQEIFVKSIAKAILVGGLIVATQAAVAADSAFPQSADDYFGPSVQSTYADSHASDPVTSVGSAIPEGADDPVYGLPARSTYADSHATDPVTIVGSAIPEGADDGEYGLPARSTYADRHLQDPVRISQPAQADTSAD